MISVSQSLSICDDGSSSFVKIKNTIQKTANKKVNEIYSRNVGCTASSSRSKEAMGLTFAWQPCTSYEIQSNQFQSLPKHTLRMRFDGGEACGSFFVSRARQVYSYVVEVRSRNGFFLILVTVRFI